MGVITFTGCASNQGAPAPDPAPPAVTELDPRIADFARLCRWLTGSFSSSAQAKRDPDFLDVVLHIVPIWDERADGHWFYVEQAKSDTPEQPYRQRVYRLTVRSDGAFQSEVFTFRVDPRNDPIKFVGAWKHPEPLAGLTPANLEFREGCTVALLPRGESFEGGTEGTGCPSTRDGATYATSQVTVRQNSLITWDRGFNSQGVQVWGSAKGGYEFQRIK